MSVLIKGFEMPKDGCKDCVMVKRGQVFDICPFLKQEVNGNVERGGKPNGCPLINVPDTNVGDTISRASVCEILADIYPTDGEKVVVVKEVDKAYEVIQRLPSAQPEPLTDTEQRIFLVAMNREEKVCRKVDDEYKDLGESCEVSLVGVCREIMRKVKGALWTN